MLVVIILSLVVATSPIPYLGNPTLLAIALTTLIMVFLTFFWVIARDDVWGLVLFLISETFLSCMEWDTVAIISPLPAPLTWSILYLLLFVSVVLVRRLVIIKKELIVTSLDKYIFAFIGTLFLSALVSSNPLRSFSDWFQIAVSMPMFFFLITNCVHTKEDVIVILGGLIVRGIIRSFTIFYFSLQRADYNLYTQFIERGGSPLLKLIGAQVSVIILIPIAVTLAVMLWSRSWKWVLAGLAGIYFFLVILNTQTRSPLLLLAITCPIVFLYRRGIAVGIAGFMTVIVIIILASESGHFVFGRFGDLTSIGGWASTLAIRLDGWTSALHMMRDYPFFGIGLGMWEEFIPTYGHPFRLVLEGTAYQLYITHAHNLYLNYGAEAGVGALLVLLLLVCNVLKRVFLLVARSRTKEVHTIAIGLAWILVGYFFKESIFNEGGVLDIAIAFWVPIGLVMVLERIAVQDASNRDTTRLVTQ